MRKFRILILLFGLLAIFGVNKVVKAEPPGPEYTLEFNVEVPEGTEGKIFVVGSFTNWLDSPIGPLQPIELTKGEGNTYSGSVLYAPMGPETSVTYKYTNARNLGELIGKGKYYETGENRTLTLTMPTSTANDTGANGVAAWNEGGYKVPRNISIKYFVDNVQEGAEVKPPAELGELVNFTKKTGTDTFAFWVIDGVVRTDLPEEFTIRARMKMNLEAHYVSSDKWAVVFLDSNLKKKDVQFIDREGVGNIAPTAPAAPTKTMLAFNGWASIDAYETVIPTLLAPTKNTFYVANYSLKSYANRNVTINDVTTSTPVNTVVTATTLEPNFSYWIDDITGAILSHQNPYKFTLLDQDISLRSIHGMGDKTTEPMVGIRRYFDIALGRDIFVGQFDNLDPTLYEIIQFGFIHDDKNMFTDNYVASSYNPETNEFMVNVSDDASKFADNDYKMRAYLLYYQKLDPDDVKFITNKSHYEITHELNAPTNHPAGNPNFYMRTNRINYPNWDVENYVSVTYNSDYGKYYSKEIIIAEPGEKIKYEYKYLLKENWATVEDLAINREFTEIQLKNEKVFNKPYVETAEPWKAMDVYRVYIYDETLLDLEGKNLLKNPEVDMAIHYWDAAGYPDSVYPTDWDTRPSLMKNEIDGYWWYDIPTKKAITDPNFKFNMIISQRGPDEGTKRATLEPFDVTKPYTTLKGWNDIEQLSLVEGLIYENSFEIDEGFVLGDTYISNVVYHGPHMKKWGVYYGNIGADYPDTGVQTLELRYNSSRPNVRGYAFTDFELEKVNYIDIKAQIYGTVYALVAISISNDGGKTWVEEKLYNVGSTGACIYNIPEAYKNDKIRIKIAISTDTLETGMARLIIDNVKIYGMTPNTCAHQADVQLATITVPPIITENNSIPNQTADGTSIFWGAEPDTVIDPHYPFVVTQPAQGQPNAPVKLTADVTKGNVTRKREFFVIVPALEYEYMVNLTAGSDSVIEGFPVNFIDYLTGPASATPVLVNDVLDSYGTWSGKASLDTQKGFGQDSANALTYTAKSGYYIYSIQIEGYTNSTNTLSINFAGQTLLTNSSTEKAIGEIVTFEGTSTTSGTFSYTGMETFHITKIVIVCRLIGGTPPTPPEPPLP